MSSNTAADIAQREEFFNQPDVARMISKYGVPKSKKAWETMISENSTTKLSPAASQGRIASMSFVSFTVHPQQINVRDKANGKVIAVIPR
jgi:hypothetical protein